MEANRIGGWRFGAFLVIVSIAMAFHLSDYARITLTLPTLVATPWNASFWIWRLRMWQHTEHSDYSFYNKFLQVLTLTLLSTYRSANIFQGAWNKPAIITWQGKWYRPIHNTTFSYPVPVDELQTVSKLKVEGLSLVSQSYSSRLTEWRVVVSLFNATISYLTTSIL